MSDSTHKLLLHPLTGQPLAPIGFRAARPGEVGAQPIWPIMGGSGDAGGGEPEGGEGSGKTPAAGDEFTPITTQADLDKVIGPRLERERGKVASQFADYDDMKTKAAEFDKLADANKTEIEKATERATKAEAEAAKVPSLVADSLRTHLVGIHSIDADKADLFLTANDPELLLRQVQALVGTEADRKKNGNRAPREGQEPQPSTDPRRGFLRDLASRD